MVFSTELAKEVKVVNNNSNYLEAGIHDNVKFVSARKAESPNGNKFIEFTFEKDGKKLVHTEWEPTAIPGMEDNSQTKATNQVARIMRILQCFYPKNLLVFTGDSYDSFVSWVVSMLESANKDILLKVKVVYNNKGYTTLPSYTKFAFIEPMVIPVGFYEEGKNDSMIREITGIDQFTKTIVADKEKDELNPFATEEKKEDSNSELPF